MGLFNKINSVLERAFGVRINPVSKTESHAFKKENSYLLIEFMGASGVGKTTLRNYYLKNHKVEYQFPILTEKALKNYSPQNKIINFEELEIYNLLFQSKLQIISSKNKNFINQQRRIELFAKTLNRDLLIRHFIPKKTFILDQHLFKFFTEDFIKISSEQKKDLLKNRLIIYCEADPKTILNHIKTRSQKEATRPVHLEKKSGKILEELRHHLEKRRKEIQVLKNLGARILVVDTANDLQKNTELIDGFISESLNRIS